jgi:hypothetical protein
LPSLISITALEPVSDRWKAIAYPATEYIYYCANISFDSCNRLISADSVERFCVACRHNRTIPSLLRLKLPSRTKAHQPGVTRHQNQKELAEGAVHFLAANYRHTRRKVPLRNDGTVEKKRAGEGRRVIDDCSS